MKQGMLIFMHHDDSDYKYGVGLELSGERGSTLHTYRTREELETGYGRWLDVARKEGFPIPVPFEKINGEHFKILIDILKKHDLVDIIQEQELVLKNAREF